MEKEPGNGDFFFSGFPESEKSIIEKESLDTNMEVIERNTPDRRIKMSGFKDIYKEEEIEEDIKLKDKLKSKYGEKEKELSKEEKENNRIARNLERVIVEVAEMYGWFPEEVVVVQTSEYDDYKNGADLVLEFNTEEEGRNFLSVDICSSFDPDNITKKIQRNVDKLTGKGNAPEVKYYESEVRGRDEKIYKGKIEKVLPVVIGVDRNNAKELFDDFANLLKIGGKDIKRSISNSPAQMIFLQQIAEQLYMYEDFLDGEMQEKKNEVLGIIERIKKEKEEEGLESKHDKVLRNTEMACDRMERRKEKSA